MQYLELQHVRAELAEPCRGRAHEIRRDASPAGGRPDVDDVEKAEPRSTLRRDRETDIVGEEHDVVVDRALERGQILLAVVVVPLGVGHLGLERAPQLAYERQILGGGSANHGTRRASSR